MSTNRCERSETKTRSGSRDRLHNPYQYPGTSRMSLSVWIMLSLSLSGLASCRGGNDVITTPATRLAYDRHVIDKQSWRMSSSRSGLSQRLTYKGIYTWSSWSDYTECSKTCGIGIRKRKRKCLKPSANGENHLSSLPCSGGDIEYKLCNIQKCENGNDDTRLRACTTFNNKYYRGRYVNWKAISKEYVVKLGHSPCALVCQSGSYPFQITVKLSEQAPNGSLCLTKHGDGVCINAQCIPVGCDVKLGSIKTYDVCGICGGNNTTCDVITGQLKRIIPHGYTTILNIPKRARNLVIVDRSKVSAVFALRGSHGIYFVGGKLTANRLTEYDDVSNTTFLYYHPMYDRDSSERLEARGPTNETLYIMMLSPEATSEIVVDYRYSIPKQVEHQSHLIHQLSSVSLTNTSAELKDGLLMDIEQSLGSSNMFRHMHSNHKQTTKDNRTKTEQLGNESFTESRPHQLPDVDDVTAYNWVTNKSTRCSRTCNNGVQTNYARCIREKDGEEVDETFCDARTKPLPNNIRCKGLPCEARWEASQWEPCSTSCGEGQQTRSVHCWRLLAPGFDSSVLNQMCQHLPKPPDIRDCIATDCGPVWLLSEWSNCSSKCGRGIQKRTVICSSISDDCLINTKPISFRQCTSGTCYNKWVVSKWSSCSGSCGAGLQYRRVSCVDPAGSFVDNENCDQNRKPLSVQACGDKPNCDPVWVAQTWTKCSVNCGDGLISRDVVCGEITDSEFKVRNERKCSHLYKPATRSRCREDPCPAQWLISEWTACTKPCGTGGYRSRRVYCYAEDEPSPDCDESMKPVEIEPCNRMSCDQTSSSPTQEAPEVAKEPVCLDKTGINCRDVVARQGCKVPRYRKLCCHSCKTRRISLNTTTYQNTISQSERPNHGQQSDSLKNSSLSNHSHFPSHLEKQRNDRPS